jgi:hypothetical protein
MKDPFVLFWAALIFASVAWYGFLVVYLGIKAGREIRDLTRELSRRPADDPPPPAG